jgi:two-component system, LytTR family, sensor kinase
MRFFRPFRPLLKGWLFSFFGWGLAAFTLGVNFVGGTDIPWTAALRAAIRDQLPWAVLTPLVFRFASRFPLDRPYWKRRLVPHFLVAAFVIWGIHEWKMLMDPGPGPHRRPLPISARDLDFRDGHQLAPPPPAWDFFHFASVEIPIYVMIVSAAHTLHFYRRAEIRAGQLAAARLQVLQGQLQPHFLFNTLNTIAGLIHKAPDKADAVLTMLSDLLRASLQTTAAAQVPLERELEFTEKYLAIMHVRYQDRVRYKFDIAPDTLQACVPSLLLQPLVENAIKHGIEPNPQGGQIDVRAWRDGHRLQLTISDSGRGVPLSKTSNEGIGLASTRARLRELFGQSAELKIGGDNGLIVEIAIPFQTAT